LFEVPFKGVAAQFGSKKTTRSRNADSIGGAFRFDQSTFSIRSTQIGRASMIAQRDRHRGVVAWSSVWPAA
jgi:hypothetical protein